MSNSTNVIDKTTDPGMPKEIPIGIQIWPIDKLVFYARNPRKNDAAVDRMCGSICEFGFKIRAWPGVTAK